MGLRETERARAIAITYGFIDHLLQEWVWKSKVNTDTQLMC